MKSLIKLSLIVFCLLCGDKLFSQTISIIEARQKAVGSSVTVKGIVTATEFGYQLYIQDNTAGISLYDAKLSGISRGDSLLVSGVTKDYNGELEISPVSSFSILNSGNALPEPKLLTFAAGFSESYQGQLVRFNKVSFKVSGTFDAGTSGKNYKIIQNSMEKEARIKPTTDIAGKNIPTGEVAIVGIMSHYKTSYSDIYQLYPRSYSDIILGSGPIINSPISQINITAASFGVTFSTAFEGNTIVKYGLTKSLELGSVANLTMTKSHQIDLTGLSPATFYYIQAISVDASSDSSISSVYYMSTASLSSGRMIVYFNNPVNKSFAQGREAVYLNKSLDDTLVAYISRATQSIDMSIYNINNQNLSANISTALNNAYNRGVRVRIVADGSTANLGLNDLVSGIKYIKSPTSAAYGIMHNKFIVFDANSSNPEKAIVWTGSTNLTDDQIHTDKNNTIIIYDQALAKAYTLEFEEMFGSSTAIPSSANARFGPFKKDNTPHTFNIGGNMVELFFSPTDGVNSKIMEQVGRLDKDLYLATYVFTRTEIANPILAKYNSGVYVGGIIGDIGGNNAAAYDILKPTLDTNILSYTGSGIFHHKYAIFDQSDPASDPVLLTGSHNWSRSADEQNDENTLMIHSVEIANLYLQEWAKRFQELGGTVFVGVEQEKQNNSSFSVSQAFIFGNQLRLNMNVASENELIVRLINPDGRILIHESRKLDRGSNLFEISLPKLGSQIYLLELIAGNQIIRLKLLKY